MRPTPGSCKMPVRNTKCSRDLSIPRPVRKTKPEHRGAPLDSVSTLTSALLLFFPFVFFFLFFLRTTCCSAVSGPPEAASELPKQQGISLFFSSFFFFVRKAKAQDCRAILRQAVRRCIFRYRRQSGEVRLQRRNPSDPAGNVELNSKRWISCCIQRANAKVLRGEPVPARHSPPPVRLFSMGRDLPLSR